MKTPEELIEELKNEKLLRCPECGRPFIPIKDSIEKKITGYLWKPNCKHYSKNFKVGVL